MKAEWTNSDSLTTSQTTKAILVTDMPKCCNECKCNFDHFCNFDDFDRYIKDLEQKPDWCLLKPMLQKKERELWEGRYKNYYLYRCGWNDCIDAILEPNSAKGETE